MDGQRTADLYNKHASVDFNEERFAKGYLDEWPTERKRRIFELVRSAELTEAGQALDFGCGNGVLTEVVRQALPATWSACGADISAVAIQNARSRYPQCSFFPANDDQLRSKKFDFLFTPDWSSASWKNGRDRSVIGSSLPWGYRCIRLPSPWIGISAAEARKSGSRANTNPRAAKCTSSSKGRPPLVMPNTALDRWQP
jgi:SAM-dependent methyltransferase